MKTGTDDLHCKVDFKRDSHLAFNDSHMGMRLTPQGGLISGDMNAFMNNSRQAYNKRIQDTVGKPTSIF